MLYDTTMSNSEMTESPEKGAKIEDILTKRIFEPSGVPGSENQHKEQSEGHSEPKNEFLIEENLRTETLLKNITDYTM